MKSATMTTTTASDTTWVGRTIDDGANFTVPERLGRYQLGQCIARGGAGMVYEAYDPVLSRRAAIKFLQPELASNEILRLRFRREARVTARLAHQNIVAIHGYGEHENVPYIVMEFVDGPTTDELIEDKPLSIERCLDLMLQAARALESAAKADHVHRDIKPSNLLITKDGRLKVADFGLARPTDDSLGLTRPKQLVGTPYFMSPEQSQGTDVDFRSDMYSLGATFYYLSTGTLLFDAPTVGELIYAHLARTPRPIDELRPELPRPLCAVFERLLQKDASLRYPSYGELVDELEEILRSVREKQRLKSSSFRQRRQQRRKSSGTYRPPRLAVMGSMGEGAVVNPLPWSPAMSAFGCIMLTLTLTLGLTLALLS